MDRINIEIKNWREFQTRTELKTMNWFRLDRDIFDGETYYKLGNEGMIVFIYFLSIAAKKNNPKFEISLSYTASKIKLKESAISNSIKILQELQILHGFVTNSLRTRTDSCDTDNTDNTDITDITDITDKQGSQKNCETSSLHPLIVLWNTYATKFSKVKKSNSKRDKRLERLWPQNTPDEWCQIIQRINKSDFCTGKNNRGWKATFDWIMQEEVHLKISEGKYDNRTTPNQKRFANERDHDEVVNEFNTIASGIDPTTGKSLGESFPIAKKPEQGSS